MTGHVFISYCSEDRTYVDRLVTFLDEQDIPTWHDSAVDPGDRFEAVIRAHIAECAVFVVVMSPAAAASVWVSGELMQAIDARKQIMPLLRSACEMPVPLRSCKHEDVTSGDMPSPQCLAKLRELVGLDGARHGRHRGGPSAPSGLGVAGSAEATAAHAQAGAAGPVSPAGGADPPVAPTLRRHPTDPPFTEEWPPPVLNATLRAELSGHDRAVYAVAIAADGRWLASAGEDGTVRVWDLSVWGQAAQAYRVLTGHTERVTSLAIAPAGHWLASAGEDGKVRIWDARTYRCRATILAGRVSLLALLDDGTLVTAGDAGVQAWELAGRRVRTTLADGPGGERKPPVTALALAPCQAWLATGDAAGAVRFWDVPTGTLRNTMHASPAEVTALTIAPDGSRAAVACDDGTLRIWRHHEAEVGATFVGPAATKLTWTPPVLPQDYRLTKGGRDTVWSVAIAPDATWLVTAESDRLARIWDTSTGDVCAHLRVRSKAFGRRAATLAVAIAPDGFWLATGDSDGVVRIWDVARSGQEG